MSNSSTKLTGLLLCLLVLLAPLSGIAMPQSVTGNLSADEMPCHQSKTEAPQSCPETGLSGCDCCDFAVTASLIRHQLAPDRVLFTSQILPEPLTGSYISRFSQPPYRPPRIIA